MKAKFLVLLFSSLLLGNQVIGQSTTDSTKTETQVTLAYPIGSNGHDAPTIENNFSFNILYGVNGPVNGMELGTLANVTKGSVEGLQLVGITNYVEGSVEGAQFAGINNAIRGSLTGLQISGISNVVPGITTGAQITGISNYTRNQLTGAQISAVSNYASERIKGAQITGISNVAHGKMEGAQIAGIHNLSTANFTGAQIAGLYNQTQGTLRGAQIGLINSAHVTHGFQFGVLNMADSSTGFSFGLLNLIKNGYHGIEISTNEVFQANAAVKLGTNEFYNIYQGGINTDSTHIYSFGAGFGNRFYMANWIGISTDLTVNYVNELEKFDWAVNLLTRADVVFDLNLNEHITLLIGPSFNMHVSDLKHTETGEFLTNIAQNPFYEEVHEGYQLQMWVGGKAGLRVIF